MKKYISVFSFVFILTLILSGFSANVAKADNDIVYYSVGDVSPNKTVTVFGLTIKNTYANPVSLNSVNLLGTSLRDRTSIVPKITGASSYFCDGIYARNNTSVVCAMNGYSIPANSTVVFLIRSPGGYGSARFTDASIQGATNTAHSINVAPMPTNHSPVFGVSWMPVIVNVGQPAGFSFSATDADNDDLNWTISWGDSETLISGPGCPIGSNPPPVGTRQNWNYNPSHTWNTAGNYTVRISAGDCNGGTVSTTMNVNVVSSFSVSKSTTYAGQNVVSNTAGVKLGSYVLQNPSTSESIRVTNLDVYLATNVSTGVSNFSNLRVYQNSVPVGNILGIPSTFNSFAVDFTVAPGATKTIDIFADLGSATSGSINTGLNVSATGSVTGNSFIQNGTGGTIYGQTINITDSKLMVSLSPLSPSSQFVAVGNTGTTNTERAIYKFASTNASSIVTELKFNITSPNTVTSVSVGGVQAPVIDGVAYLTGLNLIVPENSQREQHVLVSYAPVGINGVYSGSVSGLTLSYVKSISAVSATETTSTPNISAPEMALVGSQPRIALSPSLSTLTPGLVDIGHMNVSADSEGDITLNDFSFIVNLTSGVTVGDNIIIKDNNDQIVATSNAEFSPIDGSGFKTIVYFSNGYQIPAGTTQTFRIFVQFNSVNGVGQSATLTLNSPHLFNWTDTAGGATAPMPPAYSGYLSYNYPTNTVSVSN